MQQYLSVMISKAACSTHFKSMMQSIGERWMGQHLGVMSSAISFMLGRPGSTEVITQPTYRYKCIIMIRMEMLDKTASQMHVAQRIVWPTMWNGWRGNGCHILPLTGLNAFVFTGLNAQKPFINGWLGGRTEISGRPYSKSTCGVNNNKPYKKQTKWFGEASLNRVAIT